MFPPVRSSEEVESWLVRELSLAVLGGQARWVPSLGRYTEAGKPQRVWQWLGSEDGGQTLLSR